MRPSASPQRDWTVSAFFHVCVEGDTATLRGQTEPVPAGQCEVDRSTEPGVCYATFLSSPPPNSRIKGMKLSDPLGRFGRNR